MVTNYLRGHNDACLTTKHSPHSYSSVTDTGGKVGDVSCPSTQRLKEQLCTYWTTCSAPWAVTTPALVLLQYFMFVPEAWSSQNPSDNNCWHLCIDLTPQWTCCVCHVSPILKSSGEGGASNSDTVETCSDTLLCSCQWWMKWQSKNAAAQTHVCTHNKTSCNLTDSSRGPENMSHLHTN